MPTIKRGTQTSVPTEAQMPEKKAEKSAQPQEQDPAEAQLKAHTFTVAAGLAEEAATRKAMQDRIDQNQEGPVVHVPTSLDEQTEVANKEGEQVNQTTSTEGGVAEGHGEDQYRRVYAQDGPININERNNFDPFKPDVVSTNPALSGPVEE